MLPYADFPVIETIDLREMSDIRHAIDRMVDDYISSQDRFSYRVLLPRDPKSTAKARRMGLAFQGEFVLGLRKRNAVPMVREVRYVHDESHYGWVLASPKVYEKFEKGG